MECYSIEFNGENFTVQVREKSFMWAKGVEFTISKSDGALLNKISYASHPDFENFELYESYSLEKLINIAMARLESDMDTSNFRLATENGIPIILPINRE